MMKTVVAMIVFFVVGMLAMGYGSSYLQEGIASGMHSNREYSRPKKKNPHGSLFTWKKSRTYRDRNR